MFLVTAVGLLSALVGLAQCDTAVTFPPLSGYAATGSFAMSITSKSPANIPFTFGRVGPLTGFAVIVQGKNYFSMISDGERSFMSQGEETTQPDEFMCQSEPGDAFRTLGMSDFAPLLRDSGERGTFGTFFNTTKAAALTATLDTCWIVEVPMYECEVTAWVPVPGAQTEGVPPVLGFRAKGTFTGIPAFAEIAFRTFTANATQADVPDFDVPKRCKDGPPPKVCSDYGSGFAADPVSLASGPSVSVSGGKGVSTGASVSTGVNTAAMYTYKNVPASTGLVDENSADLLGESVWLCWHTSDNRMSSIVTEFGTVAKTDWGAYAQCNVKECANPSPNTMTVGRQIPGVSANKSPESQCGLDSTEGYWYSWPSSTKCQGDRDPSDGSCAWSDMGARKSITVGCLKEVGFYDACPPIPQPPLGASPATATASMAALVSLSLRAGPGGLPHNANFTAAAIALGKAFQEDDIANGGCPNVM